MNNLFYAPPILVPLHTYFKHGQTSRLTNVRPEILWQANTKNTTS